MDPPLSKHRSSLKGQDMVSRRPETCWSLSYIDSSRAGELLETLQCFTAILVRLGNGIQVEKVSSELKTMDDTGE
jgi:hypothetical protein